MTPEIYEVRVGERSKKATVIGPNLQNPEFKESILSKNGSFRDLEIAQKVADALNFMEAIRNVTE